jgi:hypothetical protein
MGMKSLSICGLALLAAACSPESEPGARRDGAAAEALAVSATRAVMTPEGLGQLRIGGAVPAGWGREEGCRDLAGDGWKNAYAMARGGVIRRISVRAGSGVVLEEGIGPGTGEAALRAAIPGLRAEADKYRPAPAKVLTVPFSGDGPTLRFDIGADGRIAQMSAGLMPEMGLVEGCG